MMTPAINSRFPRAAARRRPVVVTLTGDTGFDPMDALSSVREYRLRKIAIKRIPSRIA